MRKISFTFLSLWRRKSLLSRLWGALCFGKLNLLFSWQIKKSADPPFLTASELERQLQQNYGPDKIFSIHFRLPLPAPT
jgi:hypothetical protein